MPYSIDDIIREVALQTTISERSVRANVIREFVYRAAAILTDATRVIPEVRYDGLDIKAEIAGDVEIDYPVAEGAEGDEGRVEWQPFNWSLAKGEGSFKITDEAVIRQYQRLQYQTGVKRVAEGFAKKKNYNIMEAVVAGYTLTNATTGAWDGGTPKIVEDVNKAISTILESDAARVTYKDVAKIKVCLPIKAFNLSGALTEIANLKMSYRDYLGTQYKGIEFLPFKDISTATGLGGGDDGYVVVSGLDTGKHGVYRGGKVPLTEEKRVGAATKHIVRQFFATKIMQDSETVTTSSKICRMSAILGTP